MGEKTRKTALHAVDAWMAAIPRRVPDKTALQNCKVISHRGEHDNVHVMENTLPAFDIARTNGAWGIECDIRWTADLVPVICHDHTAGRVFGDHAAIRDLSLAQLRHRLPMIPTLQELLDDFGGNTHLMLELKEDNFPQMRRQRDILRELLSRLRPGEDFHMLALDPALFELVDFLPRSLCFPVAMENVAELCHASIEGGYGGLGGHFLLLTDSVKDRLERAGQRIGTGFTASKNCLFRELNRGVEWIFSNHAVKIQKIRDHYLQRS